MRAFADALDAVPMALAENSGLSPIETLASIKSRQVKEKNTRLGVDCMMTGSNDMREHFAIDPLIGKRQQLLLATQLCRMVLKVWLLLRVSYSHLTNEYLDQQRHYRW
jgi:T-complex protein 1 subunit epsilon